MSEQLKQRQDHETVANRAEVKAHHERLEHHHEKNAENAKHDTVHEREHARVEIHEQAISGAEYAPLSSESDHSEVKYSTKDEKQRSFNATMHHVRNDLKIHEKTLSKIIHQPAIEKASEIAGTTIARPSGILGATVAAFIGLLLIYGIAKFAGFELSGSEMPILLAVGFVLGLLIEWLYKSVKTILGRN